MVCDSKSIVPYSDRCLLEAVETALPSDDEDDDRPSAHLRLVRQVSTCVQVQGTGRSPAF